MTGRPEVAVVLGAMRGARRRPEAKPPGQAESGSEETRAEPDSRVAALAFGRAGDRRNLAEAIAAAEAAELTGPEAAEPWTPMGGGLRE